MRCGDNLERVTATSRIEPASGIDSAVVSRGISGGRRSQPSSSRRSTSMTAAVAIAYITASSRSRGTALYSVFVARASPMSRSDPQLVVDPAGARDDREPRQREHQVDDREGVDAGAD